MPATTMFSLPSTFSLPSDGPGIVRLDNAPSVMQGPDDLYRAIRPLCVGLDHERMWAVALDKNMRVIEAREIARGSEHRVQATADDIYTPAERCGATYLVLMHNHPNDDVVPSYQDITTTATLLLFDARGINGHKVNRSYKVNFLDHMVITPNKGYTAIIGDGYLTGPKADIVALEEMVGMRLFHK